MKFCLGIFGYCSLCQGSLQAPDCVSTCHVSLGLTPLCCVPSLPHPANALPKESPKNGKKESSQPQQH